MASGAQTKVPDDHPLMIAWKAWQNTTDYDDAQMWAKYLVVESNGPNMGAWRVKHPHLEGALWAMFSAGFSAGQQSGKKAEQP